MSRAADVVGRFEAPLSRPIWWRTTERIRTWLLRNRVAALSLGVLVVMGVAAAAAPLLTPYSPHANNSTEILQGPSWRHFAGTDQFGRDMLTRLLYGGRASLAIGVTAVVIGPTIGMIIGAISGYAGGKLDLLLQRIIDALISFPLLVMALLIIAATGPGTWKVAIAIAVVFAPRAARLARSSTLSVSAFDYVLAAKSIGASDTRIVVVHVIPGILAPMIVLVTAELGTAIIVEASLSFLGWGVPPPTPSWGEMVQNGRKFITTAPWLGIIPGLTISAAVLAANLLGDSLRDSLDPRLRQ